MKTRIQFYVALASCMLAVNAATANDKYTETMQANIEKVYNAGSIEELQPVVNNFERIAVAEKTKWEPYYYASFGYTMMANREKDGSKKDGYLDQALNAVAKAKELAPTESEVIAMEGFVHMLRVTVDPAARGQQYSGMAMQAFGKAVSLNPENPRALAMLAQMQYGMAQFFGNSTADACATATQALVKFDSFASENVLARAGERAWPSRS
ncbi:MAG: hypothetical protein HC859_02925 [Bacteroidia bacterium]|nr:hypothetical protein [Bacteroidia bacterium]